MFEAKFHDRVKRYETGHGGEHPEDAAGTVFDHAGVGSLPPSSSSM